MVSRLTLLACLTSTLFMTGVIVFVQIVHYPLFSRVETAAFRPYHAEHVRRTTWVVIVPMVVELVTSVVLVARPPAGSGVRLAVLGLGAAILTWIATAAFSVPLHDRLSVGFDAGVHGRLVATNAVRLAAWIVHSTVLLVMTARLTA